ncbi:MAG: molecular chaperone DnaJ [Chloroflexi bacterium]|nr:molecular chaperone DnaJ [Chloroflexota bacterium]
MAHTTKRDYYETLGVSRNAPTEEIKKAFRKLAMRYHPDRNREDGAEARFKEIGEAYEVLSDSEKRTAYDRYGHAGLQGFDFGQPFEGFDFGGFGDIFDAFFSGTTARRSRDAQRGADRRIDIDIDFEEAAFGCEKEIEVSRNERCSRCGGNRAEPGSQLARCPSCEGSGQVRRVSRSFFGQFVNVTICPQCQGEGRLVKERCKDCKGAGRQRQTRTLMVKIPAGVSDGSQMRLSGEGDVGANGGGPGHLYVVIGVRSHPHFQRDEDDLVYNLELNLSQAALGCEAEIPALGGKPYTLKIPNGTQSGRVFVLRGKGVPRLHGGGRGDLLVHAIVIVPTELTDEQRTLLLKLAESFGTEVSDEEKGILGKIKDALG